MMRTITAIVRPFLVEQILNRLKLEPIEALQVTEVQGFGRQKDYLEEYNDSEFNSLFLPKVQMKIVVAANRSDEVIDAILQTARSGRIGDGKVFVTPVERCVDIHTFNQHN